MTVVHLTPMGMTPSLVAKNASAHLWVCELATFSVTSRLASVIARTMWWVAGESMLEVDGLSVICGRNMKCF